MLLTMFIQLDGHAYWLNSQVSLKPLASKIRTLFACLWLFGFYSPLTRLIAHAHLVYTRQSCAYGAPVSKGSTRDLA